MKKHLLNDKYPINSLEIPKCAGFLKDFKSIISYFKEKIESHPFADFIADFDHLKQTNNIHDGVIAPDILRAQVILFCFGKKLESPLQLSVRPRSIGVVETIESFVISFLEVPNPILNDLMGQWSDELVS